MECGQLCEKIVDKCDDTVSENSSGRLNFSHLLHPLHLQDLARNWLKEDTPNFDYGGFVVGETIRTAVLICKGPGVFAGAPFFEAVFNLLDCTVRWNIQDGDVLKPISYIGWVTGKVRHLLLGERVALNCLSRASGVATYARRLRDIATKHGWHGDVAGTRKTTPGFRMVEKYSLFIGGISTHRYDLSSMVMLKDNHIWSAGNITQAVNDARMVCGFSTKIEVECRTLAEGLESAKAGADVVMLDNFEPSALHKTAESLKSAFPKVLIEASGGITENKIIDFMSHHVDIISLSHTTQGYNVVDFSLKISTQERNPVNPLVSLEMSCAVREEEHHATQ